MADTYRPYVAELADKRGYIHPIHAKQLAEERTVTMTGDVTGTANWDFGEPASSGQSSESMALSIGEKKVTTAKLDDGAVTTPKVADDAVTLAKIDDNAMNGTVQDNDSKLATHAAVKTYVDAQISGQGTYLGKKTVAEVNAMNVNNLHNGDRVQMADAGTINLGPGGVGFDVVAGEDLILYKSGSTVQWDTMDGDFKTKQSPVSDPAAYGTTITAIDTVSQNANGEITATKKTIRTGNGSNTGVVKLSDSTSSTSGVSGGVAATPAAVKAAYDLASGKKDKQTAIDTDTSSGSGKGGTTRTLTRLQQDANGVITPTFADIPTASAQTKGLMGTAEYTKLSGIAEGATKTEASSTNGNIKIDGTETTVYSHPTQTAYTGKPTADAAPAFGGTFTVSQVTTNGTGHVTGLTDRTITIPSATATTSSNGLMSSSDKSKLSGIAEGAEVNQNAFGNVKVGSATIEADSKTDTLEIAGGTGIDAVGDTANDKVTLSLNSATQTSLGKADSAVQDVTVDGASVVNSSTKVAAVPNASTSAKGAVQLAGSIGATVASENNKAATEKAVRDAINALDAEVTSSDGTNVQVKVTEADGKISGVNVTTDNTENKNNKVSAWQTTPDNTHYPSEKLVKDGLDAKADANKVVAIADASVHRGSVSGGSWYKVASGNILNATNTKYGCWKIVIGGTNSRYEGDLIVLFRSTTAGAGSFEVKKLFADYWDKTNLPIKLKTSPVDNGLKIDLYVKIGSYSGVAVSEINGDNFSGGTAKAEWTYTSYYNTAGEDEPTPDASSNIGVYNVEIEKRQHAIASPTNDNLVAMDANGLVKDSGLTKASVESAISSAGSALQGVKVNNTTLTPDANKVVTVPLATTSADGAMSAADKTKLNGIAEGAEVNVQADWNQTNSSADDFIKNKPYYGKALTNDGTCIKVCSFPLLSTTSTSSGSSIDFQYRRGDYACRGTLSYKNQFKLFLQSVGNVKDSRYVKFYHVATSTTEDVYAVAVGSYGGIRVAPSTYITSAEADFTDFGTTATLPEGATEITPVWVANSASSSGTAPVKVDAYGALTPVPMDSTPTASSTNLMTSGDIKTALDAKDFLYVNYRVAKDADTLPVQNHFSVDELNSTSTNTPISGIFFHVYTVKGHDDGSVTQIAVGVNDSAQSVYIRRKQSGTWTSWVNLRDAKYSEKIGTSSSHPAIGSSSVPVYVNSNGEVKDCTDDFVHDGDVAQTYSSSSTAPISGAGVSDAIGGLSAKISVIARLDSRVATSTTNNGWYKVAEVTSTSTTTTYNSVWQVDVSTSISTVNLASYTFNLAVRFGASGVAPVVREFKAMSLDNEAYGNTSMPKFKLVVNGNSGNATLQLWFYYDSAGSMFLRELCSGSNTMSTYKQQWTYTSYNLVAGSGTTPSGDVTKDIDFIYALNMGDVKSTYIPTGDGSTNPINGVGVSLAIAGKQDALSFMTTAEAHSLWTNAKANAS